MTIFIAYKDIKDNYKTSWQIPYAELLSTFEWRDFRQSIISRDKHKCTICNKEQSDKVGQTYFRKPTSQEIAERSKQTFFDLLGDGSIMVKLKPVPIVGIKTDNPTILHVHHSYYIFGNAPWEYNIDTLITVCHDCHINIHRITRIPVYVNDKLEAILNLTPCIRCNGTGFLEEYHYYQNGICFRCEGRKFEEFIS